MGFFFLSLNNPRLADALTQLTEDFRYDDILALTQQEDIGDDIFGNLPM